MEMTNLLLKLCLIKYILYINVFNLKNWLILIVDSLQKWLAHSFTNREYSNFTLLNFGKLQYLSHHLSGKCLNGSVVNRGLSILLRESLESTPSPFKQKKNPLYSLTQVLRRHRKIYKVSSWQFFNGFYTIVPKSL